MLCNVCANFNVADVLYTVPEDENNKAERRKTYRHHDNYRALSTAAAQGCELCSLFRHSLIDGRCVPGQEADERELDRKTNTPFTVYGEGVIDLPRNAHLGWCGLYCHREGTSSRACVRLSCIGSSFLNIMSRAISHYPNLDLGRRWIRECMTTHAYCPSARETALPSRLLYVGEYSPERHVRLVETSGRTGFYVTLSHRWGGSRPLITDRSNYMRHLTSLAFSQLPKLFQDAAIVVRGLGYSYLWIDSLCIVQDDEEDWQRESSHMADIYTNSVITIAMPTGTGSDSAFFNLRQAPPVPPCDITARTPQGETIGKVRVALPWNHKNDPIQLRKTRKVEGDEEPVLESRAWVLQESMLSPRVLNFEFRQLYFLCRHSARLEDLQCPHETFIGDSSWQNEASAQARQLFTAPSFTKIHWWFHSNRNDLHDIWYHIVELYTRRQLTEGKDRLPALSGLASRFRQILGDEYVAGLWRGDICIGLYWRCDTSETTSEPYVVRNNGYTAPTWSWAAFDRPVVFWPFEGMVPALLIHRTETIQTEVDLFGHISSGSITATTKIRECRIQEGAKEELRVKLVNSDVSLRSLSGVFYADRPDTVIQERKVFSLLLTLSRPKHDRDDTYSYYYKCLVVEEVPNMAGSFRRIGVASYHDTQSDLAQPPILSMIANWFGRTQQVHLI